MDAPGVVVLEISSDEDEADASENEGSSPDWLSELLHDPEGASDPDVIVVDKLSCAAAVPHKKSPEAPKKRKRVSAVIDDDDDECVMLDGDPDRPVDVVEEKKNESEDLLIVAEKGQLACRDYPHPRHLCVKFPFSTSAHEKHCDKCHCYVCDSLAPCFHWGNGTSNDDHCHSSDKEEKWKLRRNTYMQLNSTRNFQKSYASSTLRACSCSNFGTSMISQRYNQQPPVQFRQNASRPPAMPIQFPNHAVYRERQQRILPPHISASSIKRTTSGPHVSISHQYRTQQVLVSKNQVAQLQSFRNPRQPVMLPHTSHKSQHPRVMANTVVHHPLPIEFPLAMFPGKDIQYPFDSQYPSVISEKNPALPSLNDLAGLESDLNLVTENSKNSTADIFPHTVYSKNITHPFNCNITQARNMQVGDPSLQCNNLAVSLPCSVSSGHDNSCAAADSVPTNLNLFEEDGLLSNKSSNILVGAQIPPPLQPMSSSIVASSNICSGDVFAGDWMSIFKNASNEITDDPAIPPGLPPPEPFLFDFERPFDSS